MRRSEEHRPQAGGRARSMPPLKQWNTHLGAGNTPDSGQSVCSHPGPRGTSRELGAQAGQEPLLSQSAIQQMFTEHCWNAALNPTEVHPARKASRGRRLKSGIQKTTKAPKLGRPE